MALPYKLFLRMTDMAEDLADGYSAAKEVALTDFQDRIGWPFRASQDQLDDWNSKRWED